MDLFRQFEKKWGVAGYQLYGRPVLLAVSGGVDSMVMAHLFLRSGIPFGVAHCNFGLRAAESDADQQLVTGWCAENGVTAHFILFDTKAKAAEWKKGTQETARDLRYGWFEQLMAEHGYRKVATAHHANDNVETLLINLFKGTGIAGLHGIPAVNGSIIRPVLFAERKDILAYAAEHQVPFRNDASNATTDYLRNAVRHELAPVAERLFPGMTGNVSESIGRFAEAEVLYRKAIEEEKKKLLEKRGQDYYIPLRKLRLREPLATICYEIITQFGFSSHQVPHVLDLLDAQTGHYVASETHRIVRNRDFLIITAKPADAADLILVEGAPCVIDDGKYTYTFSIKEKPGAVPAEREQAWLDMKHITFPLLLRKWRNGDYLYPLGMNMKKKKVSRLMIDEKIALHDKENIRLLECAKRIAWVGGLRIDERFKVTERTTEVLVVRREKKDQ